MQANKTQESVTKAAQCASLLVSDIREAHKNACDGNRAVEMLLRDLISDSVKIKDRLAEIEVAVKNDGPA
jgi:hypothetical protein